MKVLLFLLLVIPGAAFAQTVTNAASYEVGKVSPDSIATLFGDFKGTRGDILVGGRSAQILYADDWQVNFVVPSVELGLQAVRYGNLVSSVAIEPVAPGIFADNQRGTGLAAAQLTHDGINVRSVSDIEPILFNDPRPLYLTLYATGLRGQSDWQVLLNDKEFVPAYAGRQSQYLGLDQINVMLPPELSGAGVVTVQLVREGIMSNVVNVYVGGGLPLPTPLVMNTHSTASRFYYTGSPMAAVSDFTLFVGSLTPLVVSATGKIEIWKDGALIASDEFTGTFDGANWAGESRSLLPVVLPIGEYLIKVRGTTDANLLVSNQVRGLKTTQAGRWVDFFAFSNGAPVDFYFMEAQGAIEIQLQSPFGFLQLRDNDGMVLAMEDAQQGFTAIRYNLPTLGYYWIAATPLEKRWTDYVLKRIS